MVNHYSTEREGMGKMSDPFWIRRRRTRLESFPEIEGILSNVDERDWTNDGTENNNNQNPPPPPPRKVSPKRSNRMRGAAAEYGKKVIRLDRFGNPSARKHRKGK